LELRLESFGASISCLALLTLVVLSNQNFSIQSVKENIFRLCLRVWREREGKALEKRNEQVEEIEKNGREGLWRVNFSS